MSWRDELVPASFRGVPFFVSSSDRSGGRRGVTHEYPGRDVPFREDLGRKARGFSVEGYVLGPDYLAARDALLTALEEAGPGELSHPYYGPLRVAAASYTVRETSQDGGFATFSLVFEETPSAPAQPTAVPDTQAAALSSVSLVTSTLSSEFLAAYAPGARMESVAGAATAAAGAVGEAAKGAGLDVQALATTRRKVLAFVGNAAVLVESGPDVLSALMELFADAPTGVLAVYDFNPGERPAGTTSNRLQEQANFDTLQRLVQRLALVRAVELVLDETFDSYEAAVSAREALTEPLDEQAELAGDELYPALMQLRADLVKAVPDPNSTLRHLVPYTPPTGAPSLVLANRLYGNLDLEADLVARNNIARPGFVPGGVELEVLTRA